MDHTDNELQGTEGSGILGGPDVRRRIPIKLLSKQPLRGKPVGRPPRSLNRLASKSSLGDDDGFTYKQEERFECKSGDAFGSQRRFPQQLFWDYKLNLIGEKDDTPVHFCDKCGLPIKVYGRMIPCKHVFCYECAVLHEKKGDKMCPGLSLYSCTDPVQRIEQCHRGSLYMCSVVPGCKRTYLSQRDLQAHINHRHMKQSKPSRSSEPPPLSDRFLSPPEKHRLPPPAHLPKPHMLMPPPLQHDPYGQPPPPHDQPPPSSGPDLPPSRPLAPETFRIATVTTRKHSNLITVPIQDDSVGGSREPLPQPGLPVPPPPHHHPAPPVVPHPHHLLPPQQHYGPPPPPMGRPMPHPAQAAGAAHLVYGQAPPPPLSSAPHPMTPPPGHLLNQMPPYMNHPPPGPPPQHGAPPPHHYTSSSMQQFPEDQGTLSPPFSQPGGLSPGLWPGPRGPPPPRMQGPLHQGQMPGPHHPDQSRYRPYYQ